MFLTGIDWSEKYLDICVTKDSNVILRSRVDNNDSGFNCMLSSLGKFDTATPATAKENINLSSMAVAIESPHQRVVDFLLARGSCVYPVNPTAVYNYRKSYDVLDSLPLRIQNKSVTLRKQIRHS